MRLVRLLAAIAFLFAGALIGALNRQPVTLDFALATVAVPLGVALLVALLAGVLIGGTVVSIGVALPMRRRLARAERAAAPRAEA
ncbi:MAG TPA: lipopolysaccharide assembly protein LapA domain-containing protein [Lysobacter sp.]|nr:lipopolysaccharide assembly protein LapA domain-containing protein [Lysobacter sp.]